MGFEFFRRRGRDYLLAEVVAGGFFIFGVGEVIVYRVVVVGVREVVVERVYV